MSAVGVYPTIEGLIVPAMGVCPTMEGLIVSAVGTPPLHRAPGRPGAEVAEFRNHHNRGDQRD
jgi:hypothetical protein